MLSAKFLIGVAMFWLLGQVLALALTGVYLGSDLLTVLQNGSAFNVVQVSSAGVLTLPKLGPLSYIAFIPTMLSWDYPILQNEWGIIRIFLWPLSFGVIVGIASLVAAGLQGIFARFAN